ncbi:ATP-binding domain-containing protein [Acinetobacter sp. NIPH 2699]|uniref:DEAD/DEAH box helicase n=1 Tax=Acinetobacter sp. NIPH 2699 TaxID=2923433 RepID=UPI001F4AFF9E|nr:ATP-binding domain-containing protein [Acinetobacter sp. NIPH 2699]MCH7336184.1 ATP-binding domain-containing protein [Acinetobacter sp. NIPH 2699]
MIDFVFGKKVNPAAIDQLVQCFSSFDGVEGTLYIGYPMFESGDDAFLTDALLVTKEHGVVVFDLTTFNVDDEEEVFTYQDELYRGTLQKFLSQKELINRRKLIFDIEILSLRRESHDEESFVTLEDVISVIKEFDSLEENTFKLINAAIQKTEVLKPIKKRTKVQRDDSFGGVMKKIEKEIANLDSWQKKAAIESPDKPQRIRGLAGSGKTIILAMKAAYLHAYESDKRIVVTFQSRTLYQQFEKLISKFYFEHKKDEPDFDYLTIQHAWGGEYEKGVYSEICKYLNYPLLNFNSAETKYGRETAFKGACAELLKYAETLEVSPIFDYVLIDEAQDFPEEFFKLVYKFTKEPKRVVWAYDELQNLGEHIMLPPEQLFGLDSQGIPLVTLHNDEDKAQQDVMLPICYRNPPWTLTFALSVGLGIYREEGLVRMFREPLFWENIGFERVGGDLRLGQGVTLQRSKARTPDYFDNLMDPETALSLNRFNSEEEQAKWVAQQIKYNIENQELDASDILVIYPVPYTLSRQAAHLTYELRCLGIDSHIIGSKGVSKDIVFKDDSIAITHIHRAKGNEAAMVYVMNSHYYQSGYELGKKRNSLFTAITRTKAWLRVCGIGSLMEALEAEYLKLLENNFKLSFQYPNSTSIDQLDQAYGDKTEDERKELVNGFEVIKQIKNMLERGELTIDDVPEDLRKIFGG